MSDPNPFHALFEFGVALVCIGIIGSLLFYGIYRIFT